MSSRDRGRLRKGFPMAFDAKRLDRVLATAGAPSLADMMVCVRDDASLSSTRRRDLASAVRRTTAALVLPVDQVPADPAWLQPQLRALRLRALGLAKVADEPLQRLEGGAGGR